MLWVLAGVVVRALDSGEILDGTTVAGVELGGSTEAEAAELIATIEPPAVVLEAPSRSFTIRAPRAGLEIDAEASAERAYAVGRSGVVALLSGPLDLFADRELEPVYRPVDRARLERTVARIAGRVDRPPFPGALDIDPQTLAVAVEPPEAGVVVSRAATEEALLDALLSGSERIEIPVEHVAAPSPSEVEAVRLDAERYLEKPFVVRTAGGPVSFTPRQLAALLTIEASGPGGSPRLSADPVETEALVARLAARRDRPARDARLDTPAQPPVTLSEQGDLSWSPVPGVATIEADRTGRRIRRERAVAATIDAVRRGEHSARFPTAPVAPETTTEEIKGATSLLGTFTTSYPCCEPRVANIQRMAATVDGTVIGPGEQFSLNGITGERTKANGYKPAPTIGEGNKLVNSVGGGVSQFSTTAYNAAYFAGLQIDAHTPHSFYISRYPPGRESTLNFGSIDLLWTNDTDTAVVVRSSAAETSVTVSIYGDNGGRRVKAETQSRSANGEGGFDITIDRVIVYGDGTRTREPYTTSYGLPAE